MKKIYKLLFVLLISLCLSIAKVNADDATLGNLSGANNIEAGYTNCGGAPCYNTSLNDGHAHIGIRFSLVNVETGFAKNNKYVDILSPGLYNELNSFEEQFIARSKNLSKMGTVVPTSSSYLSGDNYFQYDGTFDAVNPDYVTNEFADNSVQKQLKNYMGNFDDITVYSTNGDSGLAFHDKMLWGDRLIINYNNGYDGTGDNDVFWGIDDKKFVQLVFEALWTGSDDVLDDATLASRVEEDMRQAVLGGYVIQVEPVTIINFKVSGDFRAFIYGTPSDIRAISGNLLKHYNEADNAQSGYSIYYLYNEGGVQDALLGLNIGIYAETSIGHLPAGSSSYCSREADWNKSDYYACGVGIIDISKIVTIDHMCEIETNPDPEGESFLYWGSSGALITEEFYPKNETFINQCVCPGGPGDYFNTQGEARYNDLRSRGFLEGTESYVESTCRPHILDACTITEDGIYYDASKNEITGSAEEKKKKFVDSCVCNDDGVYNVNGEEIWEKYTVTNPTLNSVSDYKTDRCDPSTTRKECTPKIYDADCDVDYCTLFSDGDSCLNTTFNTDSDKNTFTIGDDTDCVFSTENVGGEVFDSDSDSANKYTHHFNDYCSLTCAEQIDFQLPGTVPSVIAGKYWTWLPEKITLKGTRTCNATVDYETFNKDLGITNSGSLADDTNKISNIFDDGDSKNNSDDSYGLVEQLRDIKNAYDEYQTLSSNSGSYGDYVTYYEDDYCDGHDCDNDGDGDYNDCCKETAYCYEYTYTSSNTNETFTRYEKDSSGHNACPSGKTTEVWYHDGEEHDLDDSINTLETLYSSIKPQVENAIEKVNDCADELQKLAEEEGTKKYEFNPTAKFTYFDQRYKDAFNDYVEGETTESTAPTADQISAVRQDKSVSIYDAINAIYQTSKSYFSQDSAHNLIWTHTKVYDIPKEFKANFSQINKGLLQWDSSLINDAKNYSFGKIYPVSLNEDAGEKNYFLSFDYLGVDKDGHRGQRFNDFLKGNVNNSDVLDYACQYNVENDVTTPSKPDFFYRNVSLNNFDPNNRKDSGTLGKNWNNQKGDATICEIAGNEYIMETNTCAENEDQPEDAYETPIYSFKLNPDNMLAIRAYNRDHEDSGGYSNFDGMDAYDMANVENAGSEVEHSWWYTSEFITDAVHNGYAQEADYSGRGFTAWPGSSIPEPGSTALGPAWK